MTIDDYLTCDPCQKGKPDLWPENFEVWRIWYEYLSSQYNYTEVADTKSDNGGRIVRIRFMWESAMKILEKVTHENLNETIAKTAILAREFMNR